MYGVALHIIALLVAAAIMVAAASSHATAQVSVGISLATQLDMPDPLWEFVYTRERSEDNTYNQLFSRSIAPMLSVAIKLSSQDAIRADAMLDYLNLSISSRFAMGATTYIPYNEYGTASIRMMPVIATYERSVPLSASVDAVFGAGGGVLFGTTYETLALSGSGGGGSSREHRVSGGLSSAASIAGAVRAGFRFSIGGTQKMEAMLLFLYPDAQYVSTFTWEETVEGQTRVVDTSIRNVDLPLFRFTVGYSFGIL